MAKPQLNDLIEWLQSDALNRFEIYDVDQQSVISKCVSIDDLGLTPENYFSDLVEKGIRTIQIVKKRKNGSSFTGRSCGLNYALTTDAENNVAASGQSGNPAATPQQQQSNSFGLGAPGIGLGFPEIMNMKSQADRYQEAREECRELKTKNERLEGENKRLEKENQKYQFGVDTKPSAVDKLVEGIAANPAALSQIIESFKNKNPAGLNSPQPQSQSQSQLSDTKSTVVDLISNNNQVTDEHVTAAYYIILEALKGNQDFLNAYLELLKEHQIIENGSDNSNYSDY